MTALQAAGKKKPAKVLKPTKVCTLGKSRRNQWVNFDVHSCPKVCFHLKVEEQGVLPRAWDCWTHSLCNISMSITDLPRKWSHVEIETPWEQGQSDFLCQGMRDILHHIPLLQSHQKRHSCPLAVEYPEGTWFLRPFEGFFTMIPHPPLSSCVLSLLLWSLLLQTRSLRLGFIKAHLTGFACSFSKGCSHLELSCVRGGRLCTPADNSLCIHTVHPQRTQECCPAFSVHSHASIPSFIQAIR